MSPIGKEHRNSKENGQTAVPYDDKVADLIWGQVKMAISPARLF